MDSSKKINLEKTADTIRKMTVETIGKFGVGHIGGAASIVEVITALYFDKANVNPNMPKDPNRDRIVLSKGHAGPCLYSALCLKGYFDKSVLDTLNIAGTVVPSHCDMNKTIGVDMTAGSLGQGFSAAVGMAMAAKIDKKPYRVYCIIGDGESQEGQIWEAAMLAGARKLDNLTVFLDYNKMQIDGTLDEICTLEPAADKWRAFNFNVINVLDGNDVVSICDAIEAAQQVKDKPSMIILNTVKGKGIKCCEGKVSSHSVNFTEEMWKKEVFGEDYNA